MIRGTTRGGILLTLAVLLPLAGQAHRAGGATGWVEVRMTDHRAGISDFAAFWVELADVSLHRRGEPRGEGWVEVLRHGPAIDIVPLAGGRWATVGEALVEAGPYDAVRVRFGQIRGRLRAGRPSEVVAISAAVALGFAVTPGSRGVLLIDLYVEDQSDHEPGRYAVKVQGIRVSGL